MFAPGVAVTCTTALTAYPLQTAHKLVKSIRIQPAIGNTGILSIGGTTLDLAQAPPVGVTAQLQPPLLGTPTPIFELYENDVPNGIDLAEFFVASTQDGDIVFWSFNEQ